METQEFKYEGRIHVKYKENDFAFIGKVYANSITSLKENARDHARSRNKHGKRLYIECEKTGKNWVVNS